LENLKKRTKITLVTDERALKRHIAKPTYKRHIIFDKDVVGIEKKFATIELNRPIYVGVAILDLAKVMLYSFHYEKMMPQYGPEKLRTCLTDTDSFVYLIKSENVYEDMLQNIDWYDTSDYPSDHPLFSITNHKRLGKIKDEKAGEFIREFVGVRSKAYSLVGTCKPVLRAKGVNRRAVAKGLTHNDYRAVVLDSTEIRLTQRQIASKRHHVTTVEQNKLALSPIDNKRYVLPNAIDSLPWGSPLIPIADLLYEMVDDVACCRLNTK
jgi:hypothetical protein